MEEEDEAYNLEESTQYCTDVAFGTHLEEDAEDVERQAGNDDGADDLGDDVAEVHEEAAHGVAVDRSGGEAEEEGHDQC